MRFETAGEIRRLDLTPIVDLLSALRGEWSELRFDETGVLVNPLSGETVDALALVRGRHRQAGAAYRITVTSPKLELPAERRAEFDEEQRELRARPAPPEEWTDFFERQREARVQVGTETERIDVILGEDDARGLAFSVSQEDGPWAVDISIEHGWLPKFGLRGNVDLTALLRAEGTPGCLAVFLGGRGRGEATLDLGTLGRSGRVFEAAGKANRLRGHAVLDVRTTPTGWAFTGDGRLRVRGIFRVVLWCASRFINRTFDRTLSKFWASTETRMAEAEEAMRQLREAIDAEGGAVPFVHRALWDEDFDPGLT